MFGHLINLFSIAAAGTRTGRGGASCLEFDNFNINIPQFTQCGSAISIHKLDHQLVCFLPFFDIWSRHLAKNLYFYVPLACSLWSVHHLITHRPPIPGRCIFLPKKMYFIPMSKLENTRAADADVARGAAELRVLCETMHTAAVFDNLHWWLAFVPCAMGWMPYSEPRPNSQNIAIVTQYTHLYLFVKEVEGELEAHCLHVGPLEGGGDVHVHVQEPGHNIVIAGIRGQRTLYNIHLYTLYGVMKC